MLFVVMTSSGQLGGARGIFLVDFFKLSPYHLLLGTMCIERVLSFGFVYVSLVTDRL